MAKEAIDVMVNRTTNQGIDRDVANNDFFNRNDKRITERGFLLGGGGIVDPGIRMQFDGVDDEVRFGDVLNKTENDAFFLQATVYATAANAGQILGKRQGGATAIGYVLRMNPSGNLQFIFQSGSSSNRILVTTTAAFADSQPHVVRMNYDGSAQASGVDIIVDSVSQAVSVGTNNIGAVPAISAQLAVGANSVGGDFFAGVIYDVNFNGETAATGYGNTNNDWLDSIGSNDGTVIGNPGTIPWPP